jgi:hypothetical protein
MSEFRAHTQNIYLNGLKRLQERGSPLAMIVRFRAHRLPRNYLRIEQFRAGGLCLPFFLMP